MERFLPRSTSNPKTSVKIVGVGVGINANIFLTVFGGSSESGMRLVS